MRFGIIGTNFVSDFFMSGAVVYDQCEVTAVSATSLEKANRFANKYGITYRYDDYTKMAEAGVIDAVYVAVPNSKHLAISRYFLEKRIPVFCEKPLAGNLREVQELVDCAEKNGTYLQEGLIPYFMPNFTALKQALPLLGPIRQVTLNFSKYSSRYDAYLAGENPTTFQSQLSNGAIMDLGVYPLGLCLGLFGQPEKIYSVSSLLPTGADVSGTSIFVYPHFKASLSYSKASDTQIISEIAGEKGLLTINGTSTLGEINFFPRGSQDSQVIGGPQKPNFYYEIADMVENIQTGNKQSSKMPWSASLLVHRVLSECRAQSGIVYPCDQ